MPLPASSTISNFDGDNKVNNQNIPPANQTLDWDNTKLGAAMSDVAGMDQTCPRVIVRMTLASTTGAMVLNSWRAVWQNVTSTAPVIARSTTGVYTITFPTMVSDEYDSSVGITNNIAVNLGYATIGIEGAEFYFATAAATSANVITVQTATSAGTSPADLTATVVVMGYSAN
jgi:hypothetical protein